MNEMGEVEGIPDYFNREPIAQKMCELIVNSKARDISPVVLDGQWGCGKTVHAKRMELILNSEKYKDEVVCVYWNAANSDFAQNPLPMFVSTLYQYTPSDNRKLFSKKGLTMCGGAFMGALTSVANQVCERALHVNIAEMKSAADKGARNADLNNDNELQFELFLKEAGDESLRIQAAEELLKLVRGDKQLIVIIDELDRCRPDFALKMLECIKHLFTEPASKFILVMNKMSMVSSVQHLYGLDESASCLYLNKYIKWEFQLPSSTIAGFNKANCAYQYFNKMMSELGFSKTANNHMVQAFMMRVVGERSLSLREVEKLVRMFNLMETSRDEKSVYREGVSELLKVFVTCLKIIDSKELMNLTMKLTSTERTLGCVGFGKLSQRVFNNEEEHVKNLLTAALEIHLASEKEYPVISNRYMEKYTPGFIFFDIKNFESYLLSCSFLV